MALGRGLLDRFGVTAPGGPAAPAGPAPAPGGSAIERPLHGPAREAATDPIAFLAAKGCAEAATRLRRGHRAHNEARVYLQHLDGQRAFHGEQKERAQAHVDRLRHGRWAGHRPPRPQGATFADRYLGDVPNPVGIPMDMGPAVADDRQLREAEASLAEAQAAFDAVNQEIAEKQAARSRIWERIDRQLRSLSPDTKLEPHTPSEAARKAARSASPASLATCREGIAALKLESNVVRDAPPPIGTVIDRMHRQVDFLAERGRPGYLGAIESNQPIKLPELQVQSQVATGNGVGVSYTSAPDVYGFLAWLHGDAIKAQMAKDLRELADDEGAMSDAQKAQRIAELEAEILDLERTEEAIIEELEKSGPIQRRDDASIFAVLGLKAVDLPASASMF
jgi:hypothetical protein